MSSVYTGNLTVSIFGQSHAPAIGVTVDGLPAGLPVDPDELQRFLSRRAPGQNAWSTPRREADAPEFLCGLKNGKTCGAPLTAIIRNTNTRSGDYENLKDIPRPGHADYTAQVKFGGAQDVSGGGHFSGRLTAPLCIAGGVCMQLLEREGISIRARILSIGQATDSGALSGLTKYFTKAQIEAQRMSPELAEKMKALPIVHVAHHLGYQGWDDDNTSRILNSLYENTATLVFKNAKAIKNSNPRATNTLIVSDCYNQASCNFHLADRVVTVSKNYMEEVSKELGFGFDFRDILKIRKDHRNFFGIVNGYEKKLISPNKEKIEGLNTYFQGFDFRVFDENSLEAKNHNKAEFIKLISKIAADPDYKKSVIPLIDIYKFEDISQSVKNPAETPIFCATSRLVEQKGYDIAAQAILKLIHEFDDFKKELPIFVMGGAGDDTNFAILTHLKDKISQINPKAGERIFVFRGYRDQFAYAVQLASDFYLMPCRFEPCGLTQMEAMAKGALPVAMSTGGLVDTVDDGVNGFRTEVFFTEGRRVYGNNLTAKRLKNNVNAYAETLQKVLDTFYNNPQTITEMKKNAMIKNFGWDVEDGSLYKYYNLLRFGHL